MGKGISKEQARLMKLDAEILDLRYLYERERMREIDMGKRTLLLSHAFKNRLDAAIRARNRFAGAMKIKLTQRTSFAIVSVQKKEEYENAVKELEILNSNMRNIAAGLLINPGNPDEEFKFKEICHEISIQKRRVVMRERSYMNWLKKDQYLPIHKYKIPEVEEENIDTEKELVENELLTENHNYASQKTVEDILGNDPNWTRKAENNATIDLLTRPEEREK